MGNQLGRVADLNIDSFYLNSTPLSPTGYLPLKLDAITKSETALDRANRLDWREHSRSSGEGEGEGLFWGTSGDGESCRTEEKCKGKRMEFIKRFFFLPKRSLAHTQFAFHGGAPKSTRRRREILPRELLRNVFAHSFLDESKGFPRPRENIV